MKRMLSTIIAAFVLMNCIVITHAEESQTEDTPQESATMVTSLDELQTAISAAADGDTITIGKTIVVEGNCSIGIPGKSITLICADSFQGNMIKISGVAVEFVGLSIDGSNGNCTMSVISCNNARVSFKGCHIYGNGTIVVNAERETSLSFDNCTFKNNGTIVSMRGLGSFAMSNSTIIGNNPNITCFSIPGSASISNCIFQNNHIANEGGVLMINATPASTITNSQFIGNTTDNGSGAAIYTSGITTISNCFFIGNRSGKAGNDICVWGGGTLNITDTDEQLAELYAAHDLQFVGAFKDEQYFRYDGVTNAEKIELPQSNYVGALCFVSEEIPDQPPESDDNTESQDPTQSTEPDDTEEIPDNPDDTDNEESTEGITPEPPEETGGTTPTEPEDSESTMPTEPDNTTPSTPDEPESTTPTNPGATEDTTPTVPDETEDTSPTVPDETECTTPTTPVETPTVPEEPDETTPPPTPSEPENTEPTNPENLKDTMPTEPVVPDENLPKEDEGTEPTSPSENEDIAATEPDSTDDTIPEETEGIICTETENSTQIDTTDDYQTDDQDHTQYIYYIPQIPATTNTEPSTTESSVTEDNQDITQPHDFIESEEVMIPSTPTPEAVEILQESAGGNTEVDIALQELRVLVTILLVVEVLQIVCLLIIWAVPKVRSSYKGRYKR